MMHGLDLMMHGFTLVSEVEKPEEMVDVLNFASGSGDIDKTLHADFSKSFMIRIKRMYATHIHNLHIYTYYQKSGLAASGSFLIQKWHLKLAASTQQFG